MKKNKFTFLVMQILILSILVSTTNVSAQDVKKTESIQDAILLKETQNEVYYLQDNSLIKIEIGEPVINELTTYSLSDAPIIRDAEVDVEIFEQELSDSQIKEVRTMSGSLTKTDENMNSMGNIKAKLTVTYTKSGNYLHLCKATGSYTRLIYEGVVPQTSNLYMNCTGTIYVNDKFSKNGSLGLSEDYTTPTFSNVQLMAENTKIDKISAGVNYTIKCSRGVNITVNMPF